MTPSLWSVLPPGAPAHLVRDLACSLERNGYAGAFSPQLYAAPWARLGVAAASTTALRLATGIAIAGTRSPVETAHTAIDLQVLTGGRFVLGLGTSVPSWLGRGFGVDADRPLARLREVIDTVRAVANSADEVRGRFWPHRPSALPSTGLLAAEPPPIWVAALRPPMVRLAAADADGLIGHPMWSNGVLRDEVAPAVADRRADGFSLHLWRYVSIDENPGRAMAAARRIVAFYAAIPDYEPYFAGIGFGADAVRAIDQRRKGGDDIGDAISDELADAVVAIGDVEAVAEQITDLHRHCDSICLAPPSNQGLRAAARFQFAIDRLVHVLVPSPTNDVKEA